jgi:hypothetical protein
LTDGHHVMRASRHALIALQNILSGRLSPKISRKIRDQLLSLRTKKSSWKLVDSILHMNRIPNLIRTSSCPEICRVDIQITDRGSHNDQCVWSMMIRNGCLTEGNDYCSYYDPLSLINSFSSRRSLPVSRVSHEWPIQKASPSSTRNAPCTHQSLPRGKTLSFNLIPVVSMHSFLSRDGT